MTLSQPWAESGLAEGGSGNWRGPRQAIGQLDRSIRHESAGGIVRGSAPPGDEHKPEQRRHARGCSSNCADGPSLERQWLNRNSLVLIKAQTMSS